MKTSMKLKSMALIALLGAALAAPVLAQGGPGMGSGMGGGPGMQNQNAAPGSGRGMGPCGAKGGPAAQGPRGGRGMMAYNQGNMRGWELMTPEERSKFQQQMRAVKTYDECVTVQTEHRGAMEVRAKEKGVTLQTPRQNVCENLKARGMVQ